MKAVILTAGVGSRIRPLTNTKPKPLLPVKNKTILGSALASLEEVGISNIIIVTGYREKQIKDYTKKEFPHLNIKFVTNKVYDKTNTGYSLMLTKDLVGDDDFIKFDGDVVFETEVLRSLLNHKGENCLCIDTKINLAAEEVKAITDKDYKVLEVGKKLDPKKAKGESIGIEKIGRKTGKIFFDILENLMKDQKNHSQYYDDSYTTLVSMNHAFYAVDITGLKWVEIDTHEDYKLAHDLF